MLIVEFLKSMPKELAIFIAAAVPVTEVRASVPLGILYFQLKPLTVIILSVLGSVLPVIPLLWFLNTLTEKLRRIKIFDKFFDWLFHRTRTKSRIIEEFELVGLTLFVAIPFPGTGVWTGCVAAYLLGLPWIPTFICAAVGTTIASTVMWLVSVGILNFF